MRFGTFHLFPWHEDKSQEQVLQETIDLVKLSEDLGFESVWLAEHHFSRYGLGSAVLTIAATLAGVTQRMRIGTAVVVLPFYNPITLAEEVATVDLISGGRFDFGVGRGYQWSEFSQFNIPLAESRARFEEAIDIMKKAWIEDAFDYRGRFWTFNDIKVLPKPKQKPHPPIAYAASSREGYQKAAEQGYNLITGGSTATLDQIRQNLALYRETAEAAGRTYNPATFKVTRPVYVAESRRQAWDDSKHRYMWFVETQRRVSLPPDGQGGPAEMFAERAKITFEHAFDNLGIFGTPDHCIRQIEALDEVVGGMTEFIPIFTFGGWDQRKTIRSMELFAREVMPHFQYRSRTPVEA
ncbi:MAG TPA: LLM class flavin-dependent oxidoreductase [Dehalococcoidia bacterium]|nr:LLM class flavin-dependent oxidoreductase [Dehalococcoidia bacterium]